jgi:hypothetical protein
VEMGSLTYPSSPFKRRSETMKGIFLSAAMMVLAVSSSADAGLFGCKKSSGCCEPSCCAPVEATCCAPAPCCEPTCCAPAACCEPTCCAPAPCCEPTCCAPAPCCHEGCCTPKKKGLFSCLKNLKMPKFGFCKKKNNCCGGCCAPAPCCEPTCCAPAEACCEPSCCAPVAPSCCAPCN